MEVKKLYIKGQWTNSFSEEYIEVEDPANGEILGKIPRSNEEDVNLAVEAAKEVLEEWQAKDLEERLALDEKLVEELHNRKEDFADIISLELARGRKSAMEMHTYPYLKDAENYIKVAKDYKFEEKDGDSLIVKEAVGIVAAFTPWNYPLGQIIKKVIPALIAGNTFILKPSKNTPLTAYVLAEAIDKVGFPKGVFNLVTGTGSEVGDWLTKHHDVNMVTFTGSTKTGKEVAKRALDSVKRITLELGGKSPSLVLKGADLEKAVDTTLNIVYGNTGQTCSAYTRLIVPEEYKEEGIQIANDTPYGLSSAVFGPFDEAEKVARRIKAGNVQVNGGQRDMSDPFGGFKQSGLGREGGVYGLEEFLEIKVIY